VGQMILTSFQPFSNSMQPPSSNRMHPEQHIGPLHHVGHIGHS
jgi:hypothetical protein